MSSGASASSATSALMKSNRLGKAESRGVCPDTLRAAVSSAQAVTPVDCSATRDRRKSDETLQDRTTPRRRRWACAHRGRVRRRKQERAAAVEEEATGSHALPRLPARRCSATGSGTADHLIASDLPLIGGSRQQTTQMNQRRSPTSSTSRGWKAGRYKIAFQSCNDASGAARQVGPDEVQRERACVRSVTAAWSASSARSTPAARRSRSRS